MALVVPQEAPVALVVPQEAPVALVVPAPQEVPVASAGHQTAGQPLPVGWSGSPVSAEQPASPPVAGAVAEAAQTLQAAAPSRSV